MPEYELRVWTGVSRPSVPDQVVEFDADGDEAARRRMEAYAAPLFAHVDVWLWAKGGTAAIASTSGGRS